MNGAGDALLEAVEAEGWADLVSAAPRHVAGRLGLRGARVGGAVCVGSAVLPGRLLNHAVALGASGPVRECDLDALVAFARTAGRGFVVGVGPSAGAAGLGTRLRERGFAPDGRWAKFARLPGPEPGPATGLAVRRVDPSLAHGFGRVVAGSFGLPPDAAEWLAALPGRPRWECFAALDGDDVVAAGTLFVRGAAAWAAFGATLPSHRGRGAQGAILAARVREAARRGCTVVAVETGAPVTGSPGPSHRNIVRAGFGLAYLRPNLAAPG